MKKIDYTPKVRIETIKRFGKGPVPIGTKAWTPVVTEAPVRVTSAARSVSTPGGSTALKPNPQYTGGNVLGISQMAKSNALPVFDLDHAIDIARMRR